MSPPPPIRTLVVEDEQLTREAHLAYLRRLGAFRVVGEVVSARETLAFLAGAAVDLVLLDLNLPDAHGLEVVRGMRAAGHEADVLAVTAARDLPVVREAVSLGVVQYLIKPFTFATFRARLERYAAFRQEIGGPDRAQVEQGDVDRALALLRGPVADPLPPGMSPETLARVVQVLGSGPMSASEVAERLGSSRVTARRYLEHLADLGRAARAPRYGAPGRPEVEYRLDRRP